MEESNIRKYAQLMQELGLTGLEISENGSMVRLERTERVQAAAPQAVAIPEAAVAAPASKDVCESCMEDICSPMVGVFYCAPAENAAPYVKVGDVVKKGDVLCIIEAMKLMNEITAEHNGTIMEICAGNSQVVDYGHVLFRLKKD